MSPEIIPEMKSITLTLPDSLRRELESRAHAGGVSLNEYVVIVLAVHAFAVCGEQGGRRFELDWVSALGRQPDDASRAEDWIEAQSWTEELEMAAARLMQLPTAQLPESFWEMEAPRVSLEDAVETVRAERDEERR